MCHIIFITYIKLKYTFHIILNYTIYIIYQVNIYIYIHTISYISNNPGTSPTWECPESSHGMTRIMIDKLEVQ